MPIGMPASMDISSARAPSSRVTGSLWRTSVVTVSELRSDWPRFPMQEYAVHPPEVLLVSGNIQAEQLFNLLAMGSY